MHTLNSLIRKVIRLMLLAAIVALASCSFFRAPGTDDCDKILERDQMTDILADMYLLDVYLTEYQHIEHKVRDSLWHYYGGIFLKHNVSAEDFRIAIDCYLLDRDALDAIHEEILNRMSVMKSELEYVDQDLFNGLVPDVPPGVALPDSL